MSNKPKPLSPTPYLFNALLNYLVDAGYARIYMVADCSKEGVSSFVESGTFNFAIQSSAVKDFIADENGVSFECTSNGRPVQCFFPWDSVLGIYPPDEQIGFLPPLDDPWGISISKTLSTTGAIIRRGKDQPKTPLIDEAKVRRSKLRVIED